MEAFREWCNTNKFLCAVVIALVILLVLYFVCPGKGEHMGDPFYLNQMAMDNMDPSLFIYTNRERDVSGSDMQDYYLENQMNAETGVGPQYMEGNSKFVDHTDYLDMPMQFRPKVVSTGIVADFKGEMPNSGAKSDMKPKTMVAQQLRAPETKGTAAEANVAGQVAKEGFY